MKKNIALIIISIVYLISLSLFTFFLYNTRTIPAINIRISEAQSKPNSSAKDNAELKQILNALNMLQDKSSIPTLLQVFEREREHYILLMTVLMGLTTLVGIFFAVSKIYEKSELEDLRRELQGLRAQSQVELKDLQQANIAHYLERIRNHYRHDVKPHFQETEVKTKEEFILFVQTQVMRIIVKIKPHWPEIIAEIKFYLGNYITGVLQFAKKHEYDMEASWDVQKSEIFRSIVNECRKNLSLEEFELLKNSIESTRGHVIVWS